jgi:hypothetical protein
MFYRLVIRFSNGETVKFIVREPFDTRQISDKTRFAIVRAKQGNTDEIAQVFLANLGDISYIKTQPVEPKELRHRGVGITNSFGADENAGPEAIATIDFI